MFYQHSKLVDLEFFFFKFDFDLLIYVYIERRYFTIFCIYRQGEKWAALRKPTQEKMLRPAVVTSYVPLIEQVTSDFIDMLRTKKTVDDLLTELMNYTTESNYC